MTTMSGREALMSKDVNAPVAKVQPLSKLPVASKLRPPQTKRPLFLDENVHNSDEPEPKRKKSENAVTQKSNGAVPSRKPLANQRPPVARSKVTNGVSTTSRVNQPKSVSTRSSTVKAKPLTATAGRTQNPPAKKSVKTNVRPRANSQPVVGPKKTCKRPAWDLRGRLADIESQLESRNAANSQLKQEISAKSGDNNVLEEANIQVKEALERKECHLVESAEKIKQLERQVRDADDHLVATTRRLEREKDNLTYINKQKECQLIDVQGDLKASQQECNALKCSIAQMTAAQAGITAELSNTKLKLEQSEKGNELLQAKNAEQEASISSLEATITDQEVQLRHTETTRRKLHNTIQELKGNIRVFCRVRPLLPGEVTNGPELKHICFGNETDTKAIEISESNLNESKVGTLSKGPKKFEFKFDRVFDPNSTQAEVFEEISQLVQSALDGYNVCVFAYGQTGSGKTFTMEGPDNINEDNVGMISRAVKQIFETAKELQEKGWEYTMEASFLEIYNETVRDLLSDSSSKKCEIKMADSKGTDVEVTNSTTVIVTSESQIEALLTTASHNRAVAATDCNERSSRSHSVFRLKMTGANSLTDETSQGTLNLVDLAGSERLSQSKSTGERLRETKNINRSLSNLGNVIMSLANKEPHIPYRNSKLTYLLQNSLGGNSKTLMFVNISPQEDNVQESLCSLRFATKVNQCNIGTAQKKS